MDCHLTRPVNLARLAVLLLISTHIVNGQQVKQQAYCTIVLKGHHNSGSNSNSTAAYAQRGVAEARLSCNSTKPVTIGIDSTQLQQHAAAFKGVTVVSDLKCMRNASVGLPLHALLYFCGDDNVTLVQPVVENLLLQDPSASNVTFFTAAVAFGDIVHATVVEGRFSGNMLGVTVAVLDKAKLIMNSAYISNNRGLIVGGVVAAGNSTISVNNCTCSTNVAGALRGVDTASLTVFGSSFSNSSAESAAAVYAEDNSSTVITQAMFVNNTAKVQGGAVSANGYAQVLINSSTFSGNSATHGGGIGTDGSSNVTVLYSSFQANQASYGGAAKVDGHSRLTLISSVVQFNNATFNGAGLNVNSNASVLVKDSLFSDNSAGANGGGLVVWSSLPSPVQIINSTFASNRASVGAGLSLREYSAAVCTGLAVHNNSAEVSGGGMCVDGNVQVVIADSAIVGNQADFGGGIYANGTSNITITRSRIQDNNASYGGGLRADGSCSLVIVADTVERNHADNHGGGMNLNDNTTAVINGSVFSNNTASGVGGGVVMWNGAPERISIFNSSFHANHAAYGGGLALKNNSVAYCAQLTVFNNSATETGGGIHLDEAAQLVLVDGDVSANGLAPYGGGLFSNGTSNVTIMDSRFYGNVASYGGGLRVDGSSSLAIYSSSVQGNTVDTNGGGLNINNNVTVVIVDTNVTNNTASKGGGLIVWNTRPAPVSISNSTFDANGAANGAGMSLQANSSVKCAGLSMHHNSATSEGGGIEVAGAATVVITSSDFLDNVAYAAAAILIDESSQATLKKCSFSNNTASNAAGVRSRGNSSVNVDDCTFSSNTAGNDNAGYGGGFWASATSEVAINHCEFSQNLAVYGAGLLADGNSSVSVSHSSIYLNSAQWGGGLRAEESSSLKLSSSSIWNNTARNHGGGLNTDGNATVRIDSSEFTGNNATLTGGGLVIWNTQPAPVSITNSTFKHNNASNGGGMALSGNTSATCTDLVVIQNNASGNGGGLGVFDGAQVVVRNCSFASNNASQSGGGLNAGDSSVLNISGSTVVQYNAASQGGGIAFGSAALHVGNSSMVSFNSAKWGGGFFVSSNGFDLHEIQAVASNNTAQFDPDVSSATMSLDLLSNTTVSDYVSRVGSAESEGLLLVSLNTSGYYGVPCAGVSVSAQMDDTTVATSVSNDSGIAQMYLRMHKPPGKYLIFFNLPDSSWVPTANMTLMVRSCIQGEVSPSPDTCQECLTGTYSLDPTQQVCDACPPGAVCPGRAVIQPVLGSWHSAATSTQIHRCPNPQACWGDRSALTTCAEDAACRTTQYVDMQCSHGYQGNVCGMCKEGSGATKPFNCRTCMKSSSIVALYVVGALAMLVFIKLLCHFTLAENCADSRPASSLQLGPKRPYACYEAAETATVVNNQASELPKQPPTEMLRCLVLYSQRMLLVATVNVEWPPSIAYPMRAVAWFWATSSPETLSIDCVLPRSGPVPMAAQRVIFYLCMPVAALLALLVIEGFTRSMPTRKPTAHVSVGNRFASHAMVVAFFFLPAVLRIVFGLFACIPLDKPVPPPYIANAVGSFWVYDANLNCFAGYHKALSLGLGVPLLLLLCVGMPVVIVGITVANRHNLQDKAFKRHYGFLTKSYVPSRCWWEAVVVCETIVLVAISVFGVNTGPFFQCLLMTGALAVIMHLHLAVRPYTYSSTGRAMRQSISCLFFTSLVGLSFLSYGPVQPAGAYALVMGAVLLVMNLAFVCSVLWQLVQLVEWRSIGIAIQKGTTMAISRMGCGEMSFAPTAGSAGVDQAHAGLPSLSKERGGKDAGRENSDVERQWPRGFSDLDRVFTSH